jgi:hypothetical protein
VPSRNECAAFEPGNGDGSDDGGTGACHVMNEGGGGGGGGVTCGPGLIKKSRKKL